MSTATVCLRPDHELRREVLDDVVVDVVGNHTRGYDDSADIRRRYVFDAQVRS